MKNVIAKNIAILILCTTNVATAAYIVVNWSKLQPIFEPKPKKKKKAQAESKTQDSYRKVVVKEAVLRRTSEIEICYDNYLKGSPQVVTGAVVVHWTIGGDGEVVSMDLERSELDDPTLIDCVMERVKKWTFDPPPGNNLTLYAHKFSFRPKATSNLEFE